MLTREQVARRESPGERLESMHRRRPRALLLGEALLLVDAVVVAGLVAAAVVDPGVLADPTVMPPAIADARLGTAQALVALGLPLVVILLTLATTLRPGRWPWTRTHLALAWVAVAFAAWPIASVDIAAAILLLGAPAAALVGAPSSLGYLRRAAGEPVETRWSTRRRAGTMLLAAVVTVFIAGYLVLGVAAMWFRFPVVPGLGGWFGH